MMKLEAWKKVIGVLVLCAATVIAAKGQIFENLLNFDGTNGMHPPGSLVQGVNGYLYGVTPAGGTNGGGTAFKMSSSGVLTTLYNFCSQAECADGEAPSISLVLATNGNFYGVTEQGGAHGAGTVFKISPGGSLTTLYSFCSKANCADGSYPAAGLVQATDGSFYGTTTHGGTSSNCYLGCGTVFTIASTGTFTTLHSFDSTDGSAPLGALTQGLDGNFYGTTAGGGGSPACTLGCGTVFSISPRGELTMLHIFDLTDGRQPQGALALATDGNFYGTTQTGSDVGGGTVFSMQPNGMVTSIYNFCTQQQCPDGSFPTGALIQATDRNIYGTTSAGGNLTCRSPYGCGTIFSMTLGGILTTLYTNSLADGANPEGGLLQATNGTFYGTTAWGGSSGCQDDLGCGTAFSLAMGLGPFVAFVHDSGKIGQTGGILGQGFAGTTSVSLNGTPANFTVVSDTFIKATVPPGATTGFVTVVTPSGTLTSNVPFRVLQ
jgi:uncharacterized repeat protein (TIGR03803 family)